MQEDIYDRINVPLVLFKHGFKHFKCPVLCCRNMGDTWQMVVPNGRFDEEMMIKIGSGLKLLDHYNILYGLMLEITQF